MSVVVFSKSQIDATYFPGQWKGYTKSGAGPWTSCLSFCKGICQRDEVEIDASVDVTYTRKNNKGVGVLPLLVTYSLSPVTDLNAVCPRINSMTLTLLRKSLPKIIMSNLSPHLRGYQSPNWPLHRSQQKDRRRRTCNHLHLMRVDTKIRIQQQR